MARSTWSNITPSGGLSPSPHNISGVAIDPDDEQHIVISISGYTSNKKVMESFNGGQTWSNLSSGLPNIPANCVTFESGSSDGIYVGTDIGVYYHSAAFSNWVSYNKNLPNVIVVDFEIYEDDELLRIGTYGRWGVWQSPLMAGSAAPPVAAFMADPAAPCGTLDTISLIDQSQGLTTSWQWQISPSTFSYVNGTTDTSQNPQVVFSATGGYTVTLTATNAYGSDDTTVFQAISVGGAALPFVEDFENGLSGWEIDNPDGGITWASTTLNGTSPGTVGMFMNHYSYSGSGQRDELISPALDFSNDTLVSMSFEYASAYYSSGLSDSLLVHVSDDCGATWNEVGAYDATDASFTTAGAITSSFAPADSTYWCHGSSSVTCPTIDLDAYSGKSGIRVKFVAVNGYGNNTFLDNINISGQAQVAPVAAFGGDTAACTGKSVTFYDYSAPAPTARLWSFQGGTPATSTAANPTVTYANAGTYDVKLVVSNAAGIDSVLLTNYITILTAPNAIAQLDTLATLTDCAPFIIDTSVIKANHFSGNYYYIWNIFTTNGNLVTSFNGRNSLNYTITDDDTSFVVQLIVTSEYGCLNDTVNITISTIENPNPYWSLATNQGCAPFTPDIDSLAADATLTHSWIITSSTGTILYNLNGTNPTWPALNNNSYTANQPYTIKHIVQAGTGCKDSLELTVNVLPTPLAAFNVDSAACTPWTPTIINYSFGNNLTYDWDISPLNNLVSFSDTSNTIPTLSFADLQWPDYNQQYLLSLTTTSDSGCADAYTDTITLYSRPKAGFQLPTDSCGRFTLTPNDTSKTFNNITQWLWRLSGPNGDTTSTSNAPVFNLAPTYNGNHNYSLTLIVTDNNGCQDSTTENFQAFFPPMADVYLQSYTCDSTNINEILSYYAYPFDSCYNLTYDWTIDSAGTNLYTITDSIPNYILTNNDTTIISYTVTLTVTDCNGCQTTTTDTVQVLPFPNASFTVQSPPLTASGNVGSACAPWTPSISYNPVGVNFYAWTIDSAGTNIATSINSIPNYTFNNSSGTPVTYTLYLYATNQYGCSSWETQDIVVNSPSYFTQSVSSCGSYTWIDGNTYSSSTSTPTYTLTGSNGCDSVVTLNLLVNSPSYFTQSVSSCGSYTWIDGNTYSSSTSTPTYTLTGSNGCDSVVTLNLLVNSPSYFTQSVSSCGSYTWIDGNTYSSSTSTPTYTLTGSNGCDSVVTLNLLVNSPSYFTQSVSSCGSYTWIDGNTYSSSTSTPTYTLTGSNGCDSVVTLNLLVNSPSYFTQNVSSCGSYTWIDGNTYSSSTSTPTYTLTGSNGCDSVVTLNLLVNSPSYFTQSVSSCGSYTWIDGNTYSSSTSTPTYTLTGSNGCDSVVTLNLLVNSPSYFTQSVSSCGSYTWIDGNTYSSSTSTPTYTLTGSNGCDSVVTLNLLVNSPSYFTQSVSSCGSYTWIDGNTYSSSTSTPTYTLTGSNGCDSVVTLNLLVNSPSYFTQNVSSCGSYTWIDGNTYSSSTSTPTYTLTGSNGCDSVVTLNLVVVNIIPTIQRNADTIFTTSGYDLYSWYKCGSPNYQLLGTTTDHWFVVASNGDYAVSITEGNCQDTTLCLTIEDLGEKELLQPKIQIYPNPADGCVLIDKTDYTGEVYMTISSADGRVLLRERPVSNDSIIKIDVKSYASGSYIITLIGKDFSSHYTIQISH